MNEKSAQNGDEDGALEKEAPASAVQVTWLMAKEDKGQFYSSWLDQGGSS